MSRSMYIILVLAFITASSAEMDQAIANILLKSNPPGLSSYSNYKHMGQPTQDIFPGGLQLQMSATMPQEDLLPGGIPMQQQQPPPQQTLMPAVPEPAQRPPLLPMAAPMIPIQQQPMATPAKVPCSCGVFLSGQFKKGSNEQPVGNAVLMHEVPDNIPCNSVGEKQCTNKCLDVLVKHLPNSPGLVCGSMDRDCYKERAYLFVKNCDTKWSNTNLSAGREFCCKDSVPFKCPAV